MIDDAVGDESEIAPRRSTFQAPLEENLPVGEFPVEEDPVGVETAPRAPEYLPAPTRTSKTQDDITRAFDTWGTGSTGDMIAELVAQLALQAEEEAAFASWAVVIRQTRPDRAEEIIAFEREIFDGAEAGELVFLPAEPAIPVTAETDVAAEVENGKDDPSVAVDEPAGAADEPADVAEDAEEPAGVALPDSPPEAIEEAEVLPARSDVWPLAQGGAEIAPERALEDSDQPEFQARWSLFSTWGFALVPLLGLTAGAWVVGLGFSFSQALLVTLVPALLVGGVVASLARVSHPIQNTFGTLGSVIPAGLLFVFRLLAIALVVWWASRTAAELAAIAGWWSGPEWIAHTIGAVVLGGFAASHVFLRPSVMRVALWASAGLGLLGAIALILRTAPEISSPPTWAWSGEILPLYSAGSLVLVLGLLALAPLAYPVASLAPRGRSSLVATLSAIASVVPLGLLIAYSAWFAESAPAFAAGLLDDPVATLAVGLGTWFPAPALFVLVLPFSGFVAIGLLSLAGSFKEMSFPPVPAVWGSLVIVLAGGCVSLGILFEAQILAALPDVFYTAGVVIAAVMGSIALDAVTHSTLSPRRERAWRWGPFTGMVLAISLGLGLVSSEVSWLSWQGYLLGFVDSAGLGDLTSGNLGVLVALLVGAIASALSAIPVGKLPVSSHA